MNMYYISCKRYKHIHPCILLTPNALLEVIARIAVFLAIHSLWPQLSDIKAPVGFFINVSDHNHTIREESRVS